MPAEARYFEGLKQTGRRSAMGIAAEIHAKSNKIPTAVRTPSQLRTAPLA
jgi:hypothetical protein